MKTRYIAVLLLLCAALALVHLRRDLELPHTRGLQDFPVALGGWKMAANTTFSAPLLKVLRPSDYMMRSYADPHNRLVGLYVGYHDGGANAGPIHSPRNCLPGAGWLPLDSREMTVATSGGPVSMVRAVYAKDGREVIFYYWYQMQGQTLTSDWAMKFTELKNALLRNRRDAAFVRLDIAGSFGAGADDLAADFIRRMYPTLKEYLPS